MGDRLQRLSSERVSWTFEPCVEAGYSVEPGEVFVVETMDALAGQVQQGMLQKPTVTRANPATGPIAVKGLRSGQILAVDILALDVARAGYLTCGAGAPRFFDQIGGVVRFAPGIQLALSPMIGTIGIAPAQGCFSNSEAADHGGNMDTRDVTTGATLYLTTQIDEGMLSLGDVHSLQADGESSGQGIETCCNVTLRVRVLDEGMSRRPYLVRGGELMVIVTAQTLDGAAKDAVEEMARLIVSRSLLSYREARQLLGLVGDVRVGQIVNPQKTVRVALPLASVPWLRPLPL